MDIQSTLTITITCKLAKSIIISGVLLYLAMPYVQIVLVGKRQVSLVVSKVLLYRGLLYLEVTVDVHVRSTYGRGACLLIREI